MVAAIIKLTNELYQESQVFVAVNQIYPVVIGSAWARYRLPRQCALFWGSIDVRHMPMSVLSVTRSQQYSEDCVQQANR